MTKLHGNAFDLTGRRFGRLVVIGLLWRAEEPAGGKPIVWLCQCDCGSTSQSHGGPLRDGRVVSCGCHRANFARVHRRTHGKRRTAEYRIWSLMKYRCLNPDAVGFCWWGGRGIGVCERWLKFENFYADMGDRPSLKHTLDRIDNDGDYEPGNCRWVLRSVQANNKRNNVVLTIDGVSQTVAQWARQAGFSEFAIHKRLKRGWSPKDAVSRPMRVCGGNP
jgi:hypothetical protein